MITTLSRRAPAIGLLACITALPSTAFAAVTQGGTDTIDWTNFEVILGTGVDSLQWVTQYDRTWAEATISNGLSDSDMDSIGNWGSVSSSAFAQAGGNTSSASASTSLSTITGTYSGNTGNSGAFNGQNMAAGRFATFQINGSGTVTFRVPYDLEYSLSIGAEGGTSTTNQLAAITAMNFDTLIEVFDVAQIGETANTPYSNMDDLQGILEISLDFGLNETGRLGVGVGDSPTLTSWLPTAVPEPSAVSGLMGIVALFLARRHV